ncbi:hypothetical protein [Klebsiella pneumoniae]|uniref:hypothetical protein n=1 Tax=Klebsiella pneumoniae TaxID=573 RepID=UPI002730029D|nr:hypothetical protein [Klebsiella pneumoniae]MDP0667255.1 hypothetical protein [Klebsiella pneumoniae]MDP0810654.1 hypothetical protein [Klebsiella pneumoniae]
MNVYEMEGFLRGKCLPGDLKVNESNAEYLVRKLNAVSELKAELTAALATIEKCRELSGCPAGVDLQDHLRQLAAENVGLKRVPETDSVAMLLALDSFRCESLPDVGLQKAFESLMYHRKTPATDRIYVAAEARGVRQFAAAMAAQHAECQAGGYFDRQVKVYAKAQELAESYLMQLREVSK